MRVLAFEDSYNIEALLESAGLKHQISHITQRWDSSHPLEHIAQIRPDVLLLDHYMPPYTGLEVLQLLNEAVAKGNAVRPPTIVAMSSEAGPNAVMLAKGANYQVIKFDLHTLDIWNAP